MLQVLNCALALFLREECLSEGYLDWRWVPLSRDGDNDSMTVAILLIHCLYIILIFELILY